MGAGLSSAITNPLEADLMQAIRAADVLLDHDAQCSRWIEAYREPAESGARTRRDSRRRRPDGKPSGTA
jgi:5-methyltetrahydrofolate--homocysteine methyltransferase